MITIIQRNHDARSESRARFINGSSMCIQLKAGVLDKHSPGTFAVLHGLQASIAKLDMGIAGRDSHTSQHAEHPSGIIHISPARWSSPAPGSCRAACPKEGSSKLLGEEPINWFTLEIGQVAGTFQSLQDESGDRDIQVSLARPAAIRAASLWNKRE